MIVLRKKYELIKESILGMFGLISKKKLISLFAEELADKQRAADYWFYTKSDQAMSSFILEHVDEIKALSLKFGITKEIYDKAYKIYDFKNSGKKDFKPDFNKITKTI